MSCARCDRESITRTRGENFCAECYHDFLMRKLRAVMGPFRVIGSSTEPPPLILVCISFGASSMALVDLLSSMLQRQHQQYDGRVGFQVECMYIGAQLPLSRDLWPWPEIKLTCVAELALPEAEKQQKYSRSTTHDIQGILVRRTAVQHAQERSATTAFGYSMTKLSELTLAETVKGRGANIPSLVSPSLEADNMIYPMREITLPELHEHCRIRGLESLLVAEAPVPGITKMQSIDEIVCHYFANVRKDFPSVVSTVSKVALRLSQEPDACALCQSHSNTLDLCHACRSALGESRLSEPLALAKMYEL